LIVAIAVFLLSRRSPTQQVFPAADNDSLTLEQLERAGSDLSRPHEAEFFLYLPTEVAARAIADQFVLVGFAPDVHPSPTGSDWSCVLRKSMVLSRDTLGQLRREFVEAAAVHGGEYDGWGAEVEK
jgi:hypothetical protein